MTDFVEVKRKDSHPGTVRLSAHSESLSPSHLVLLPSLREGQSDWQQMVSSLGALYGQGVAIDWATFDRQEQRRKLVLPTYPFQRQRYWVEAAKKKAHTALRPLIDKMTKIPLHQETLFETEFSVEALPFLADHRVYERIVSPGACQVATLLAAAELTWAGAPSLSLTDIILPQALVIPDDGKRIVQTVLHPKRSEGQGYQRANQLEAQLISFVPDQPLGEGETEEISTHLTGFVSALQSPQPAGSAVDLAHLQQRCLHATDLTAFYANLADTQVDLGPSFRWIQSLCHSQATDTATAGASPREALAYLVCPASIPKTAGYLLHPGLLDACFQVAGATRKTEATATETVLPFALESLHVHQAAAGSAWWCHATQTGTHKWDIKLMDESGTVVASITGFEVRAAAQRAIGAPALRKDWLHTLTWKATALTEAPADLPLPDCWLVVGNNHALADRLLSQLEATGRPVFHAAIDEAAIRQRVAALAAEHRAAGVVYLGSIVAEGTDLPDATLALCGGLLHLTQALIATTLNAALWIVTQGVQSLNEEPVLHQSSSRRFKGDNLGLTAAAGALWGLGRTLLLEQPQLHCVCLDLEPGMAATPAAEVLRQEIVTGLGREPLATQVAYRNQTRYVAHLAPWQAPPVLDPAQPMRLQLQEYGSLDQLTFVPLQRRTPNPGEIEVEVKAVGLNFRDVLNALGMLKEYYAEVLGITQAQAVGLGFECAGLVTAVGEGVTHLAVGDRVMGMGTAEGTCASYLTLPAANMTPIPAAWSYAEAATLPLTFLTAWYGLVELAHLQAGERVLIHAAAGGVGQAAVQIAQAIGAEIIATASPGKWDFLRQQGITHVFNSRTLDFAAEVRQLTGGRGVDVIFNSLNGDFIEHSLAVLAQHGRFVEIGKIGVWSREQMAEQRPDVAYYPYDLGEETTKLPTLYPALWQAILPELNAGALQPLPHTIFPALQSVNAFRYMQQAKQMGKIVIDFAPPAAVRLQHDAAYLVTGGLGGLGLQVAQQLVADGARHLILTGRHGVTTDEQQQVLAQLATAGAEVHVLPADLANQDEVQALLTQCQAIAPLRGIVHTAGVLDDGVLSEQTLARFATVMRPKVNGLWHLHRLTAALDLDFLVCFSSAAALLGSAGQSNYAAANAFMDTLMQQRRRQGLPGLSINWGAWAEVGLAAHLQARMKAQGMSMITPQQGRLFFHELLQQPVAQIGVLPLTRPQAAEQEASAALPKRVRLRAVLADLAAGERQQRLEEYVRSQIALVLGLSSTTHIDALTRLFDFGLDSLMAVELKNKLAAGLECTLRSTLLFDYPTLDVLVPHLLHDCLGFAAEAPAPVLTKEQTQTTAADLAMLSEAALDDLFAQELAFLED
ncbi:MAG: SDR family NAD(P)-dependent oxidoreductase [Caldilineaceae bacterium]